MMKWDLDERGIQRATDPVRPDPEAKALGQAGVEMTDGKQYKWPAWRRPVRESRV
jgi:hypothetical protein